MVEVKQPSPSSAIRSLPPQPQAKAPDAAQTHKPRVNTAQRPANAPANTHVAKAPSHGPDFSSAPFWGGIVISALWIGIVLIAVATSGSARSFLGLPLVNWAIGVSAIASPVALIWMVAAYLQRAADVQSVAEPLRRQLLMITGETGLAEQRIRRFNHAIKEQIDLLRDSKSVTHDDLMAIMDRVRQHKTELEQFEKHSIHQVKDIQDVIRRSMQHIDQLMEDKFTMLRVLDNKMLQSGDSVARQTDSVREQLSTMLQEIEANSNLVTIAIERSLRDTKKIAEISRTQENSLLSAAEAASNTIGELSGKIDHNIARFLDRAATAREEAERLAGALDAQTRSLDDFSTTLPARVSEAEAVMRGVADRLYASEQLAREQAVNLGDKLSMQVDGLQKLLDNFSTRLVDIDGGLQQRRTDLDGLVVRISGATDDLSQKLEGSIRDMGERAQHSLAQFEAVNETARRGADEAARHIADTANRYEEAATRLHMVSDSSNGQIKALSDSIGEQLAQFEALDRASVHAGEEVHARAVNAMTNLQHVLERLLVARDATQSIGDNLMTKLRQAVDDNEIIITRINEAAQMSVRALGIATESLSTQEQGITGQTLAAETTLREAISGLQSQAVEAEQTIRAQSAGILVLMREAQERIDATETRLQQFAVQATQPVHTAMNEIDQRTYEGAESLSRYSANLQDQIGALQGFSSKVTGMGDEVARTTTASLEEMDKINQRFLALRTTQDEAAKQTMERFTDVADRLQREVGAIGGETTKAVALLQEAGVSVSEQSQKFLLESQEAGAKLHSITSALQTEAEQTRTLLQKQADALTADLSRSEQQFIAIGEALKDRTDMAYTLIDRVAAHYNEATKQATDDLEARAGKLEQVATSAREKIETVNAALVQQLDLIGNGTSKLEAQASQITLNTDKAVGQLGTLNSSFAVTQDATVTTAQKTIAQLEEANSLFLRQQDSLDQASRSSVTMIERVGAVVASQTEKLFESSQQIETNIHNLGTATNAMADRAAHTRAHMELQTQQLAQSLGDAISRMDAASAKLDQAVNAATQGADQADARYAEMLGNVTIRLGASTQELTGLAQRTESTLGSLGASVTQQFASLGIVSEQLSEQQRSILAANDMQRAQMLETIDKLGSTHAQASEVAERTIIRLADALEKIQQQMGVLSDQSQSTIGNIRNASSDFSSQANILLQQAEQAEQQARNVLKVTGDLQSQASTVREALSFESDKVSDVISGLLGKISASGGSLRETGVNAEATLGSMNGRLVEQAGALNTVIQDIADRQRSLTSALDAQRNVLDGLINRFTIAQDETSSVSQRSAERISESTRQIKDQIEAIDTQTQGTMATLQGASGRFAEETSVLGARAYEVEQQMRAVLTATSELQAQSGKLRDGMQSDTSQALDQLGKASAQLEVTTQQLKQHSSSAINNLDKSAVEFENITKAAAEKLQQQSDNMAQMAALTEGRILSVSDKIRSQVATVNEVGESAERQARKLADTAEFATTRLGTLCDTMRDSDEVGRQSVAGVIARIDEAKSRLNTELQFISDTSQMATQLIQAASEGLMLQSDALRANLAKSESALATASHTLREESNQAPSRIERTTQQIENAGRALREQSVAVNESVIGTADRFINVTGTMRDAMGEEMRNLDSVATLAETTVRAFNQALMDQVNALKTGSSSLSSEHQSMLAAAGKSATELEIASHRISQIRKEALEATEQMTQQFAAINNHTSSINKDLVQSSAAITQQVEQLTQSTARAEQQMTGSTKNLREQMEFIRTGMQSQIEEINRGLTHITAQLERTSTTLRSATSNTAGDIEKLAARFDQTGADASNQLVERTSRMRLVTEEVAKLLNGFGDQLDGLLDRMSLAGDGIKRHESDLVVRMQESLKHLSTLAERLEANRLLTGTVSDQAISRLADVAQAVEKQMHNLAADSDTVAGIVRGVGLMYGEQQKTINRSVTDAQTQVMAMNQTIETLQQRTDRMRVSLKLQADELVGSLGQILDQLSSAGDLMDDSIIGLQHRANSSKKS